MATLQSIIRRAYRESQILDINAAPSAEQENEALEILRGIIRRHIRPPVMTVWLGDVTNLKRQRGQTIRDFTPIVQNYAIPQDVYLNVVADKPYSVLLPNDPGDGARLVVIDVGSTLGSNPLTLVGNGNLVDGGADFTISTSGQRVEFMYRRDIANWVVVTEPGLSQIVPFDTMFDDMFVIELAMRINPRYGDGMSEITLLGYQSMLSLFNGRYQSQNSSAAPDVIWDRAFDTNVGDAGRAY